MKAIVIFLGIAVGLKVMASDAIGYDAHPVFSATYTVPTSNELAPYATWKLQDVKIVRNNEFVSAKYKMPSDLLEDQEFTMTGKISKEASFFTMTGDMVDAACSLSGKDSYVCLLKFKKSVIKTQTRNDYFKRLYADNTEALRRQTVAEGFSGDPVGILKVEPK